MRIKKPAANEAGLLYTNFAPCLYQCLVHGFGKTCFAPGSSVLVNRTLGCDFVELLETQIQCFGHLILVPGSQGIMKSADGLFDLILAPAIPRTVRFVLSNSFFS